MRKLPANAILKYMSFKILSKYKAHNLKVAGSNPAPQPNIINIYQIVSCLTIEAAFLRSKLLPRSLPLCGEA